MKTTLVNEREMNVNNNNNNNRNGKKVHIKIPNVWKWIIQAQLAGL